jgi:hypothetical protein
MMRPYRLRQVVDPAVVDPCQQGIEVPRIELAALGVLLCSVSRNPSQPADIVVCNP